MLLELKRFNIPPGHKIFLDGITWQEFESILDELGEHRTSRIAYDHGRLEIMTPLPEHEFSKIFIGNFVEIILEELNIDFYPLGSTTFTNPETWKGIEPDNCFYIQNEALVRGKSKLDLSHDPPPDLVLEIDITSRTHPDIYAALKVPELWRFEKGKLQINVLEDGKYRESKFSSIFPNLPLIEVIPEYLSRINTDGRNKTMRAFRAWVREQLPKKHQKFRDRT